MTMIYDPTPVIQQNVSSVYSKAVECIDGVSRLGLETLKTTKSNSIRNMK